MRLEVDLTAALDVGSFANGFEGGVGPDCLKDALVGEVMDLNGFVG